MMTVRRLISLLKKMPQNAGVGIQDHDHGEDEMNGLLRSVEEASPTLKKERGVGVVLRV